MNWFKSRDSSVRDFPISNSVFALKSTVWLVWLLGAAYGVYTASTIVTQLPWQFLLGAAFAHGVELQHQALHQTGFTSRGMNRIVGVLVGLPMMVSYSAYQDSHLFHHQKLGTDEDEEFFNYGTGGTANVFQVVTHFFLLNHYRAVFVNTLKALSGKRIPTKLLRNGERVRAEYLLFMLSAVLLALWSLQTERWLVLSLWIVPLMLFAAPIHALIELPEHYGCERTTDYTRNTRSISAGRFAAWLTNGNCFHVEHHWKAALPIEELGSLHREIRTRCAYVSTSYWAFYRDFLANERARFRQARLEKRTVLETKE